MFVRFFLGTVLASLREPHLAGRWWASRATGCPPPELTWQNYLEQRTYRREDFTTIYRHFCRRPLARAVRAMGYQYAPPTKRGALARQRLFSRLPTSAGARGRSSATWRFVKTLSSILLPFSFRSLTPEGGGARHLASSLRPLASGEFSALRCAVTRATADLVLLCVRLGYRTGMLSDCVHPHADIGSAALNVGLGRWVDNPATKEASFWVVLRRDVGSLLRDTLELLFLSDSVVTMPLSHPWMRNAFAARSPSSLQDYFGMLHETAAVSYGYYAWLMARQKKALKEIIHTTAFAY